MLINIMSEIDDNFHGSEDIVNKGDPHGYEHDTAKSTHNLQKNTLPEWVCIAFRKFGYSRCELGQLKQCG